MADISIGQALDLGHELVTQGRLNEAIALFQGVLVHEPKNFEALNRLGGALFEQKRWHEALYYFWRGRKLNRRSPMALTNYGACLSALGHEDEGVIELQKAVHFALKTPHSDQVRATVHNNLGNTLERMGRYSEALEVLNTAIKYGPKDGFPRYNKGIVLLRLNRHKEAVECLDYALSVHGDDHDARYNRGMGKLLLGDLAGGFSDYEARLLTSENKLPNLGLPANKQWQGEILRGKTILVHAEQGFGDDIQFLRYLPLLKKLAPARILLVMHDAVRPLLTHDPDIVIVPNGATVGGETYPYDYWVALMSLAHQFGTTGDADIPEPFIPTIDGFRIDKWRAELKLRNDRLNVGVCWAGNFQHKNDKHRSIPLPVFAKLFDAPGCNFISVQQMRQDERETFAALKSSSNNLKAFLFEDFRDTAAALLNLDLVVTADTAVAHLSATLGVPTFILVPAFGTDWRWQLGREDSPWYPAARLYRQPKIGDWPSVITRLRNELAAMAARASAA
jgi:tetratricopeptide (TPR) repeat protein